MITTADTTTLSYKTNSPSLSNFKRSSIKRFTRTYDVVIVGGGPAGAYLGYCLASQGIRSIILDHCYPRESPFFGTINQELLQKFPLIQSAINQGHFGNKLHLISPSGHKVIFDESYKNRFASISRSSLDNFLLDTAIKNGSIYIPEKVTSISKEQGLWKLKTPNRELWAHILVGADGVKSIVRKTVLEPLHKSDLAIGIGYYASGFLEETSLLKYFNHRSGFLWIHGDGDNFIIGITDSVANSSGLKQDLDNFVKTECKGIQPYKKWSALIPKASSPDFFKQPCAGSNWLLIGDAAGHVDPVSGKGILYALWSAELASQALVASDLRIYDLLWREEYGREFMRISNPGRHFCKPAFLDNIMRLAQRSKSLSNIIFDLVTGDRKGNTTGKRLLVEAPRILFEAAVA